jgi:hypothetical protein
MILELPTSLIANITRRLAETSAAVASPFAGTEQIQDWGGEWWEYDITIATQYGRDARRMSAFFAQLGGKRGRFLMSDTSIENPAQSGDVVVAGAAQSGNQLNVSGLVEQNLLAGDFFQIGTGAETRMHQLTQDVTVTAGAATLHFVPALRYSPINAAPVEVVSPKVLLRLGQSVPVSIARGDKFNVTFAAREAI